MNYKIVNRATAAAIGLVLASVIFAFITVGIKLALPAAAIDADRAAERAKALATINAEADNCLNHAAVIDAKRGIVRLPIDIALSITARQWANPAAARADLNGRAEKAVAPVKTESFE